MPAECVNLAVTHPTHATPHVPLPQLLRPRGHFRVRNPLIAHTVQSRAREPIRPLGDEEFSTCHRGNHSVGYKHLFCAVVPPTILTRLLQIPQPINELVEAFLLGIEDLKACNLFGVDPNGEADGRVGESVLEDIALNRDGVAREAPMLLECFAVQRLRFGVDCTASEE